MIEQINDGYTQLAKAMLNRAVNDIKTANGNADEAQWFLTSEWAEVWADLAGEDIHRLRLWVQHPPHVMKALCRTVKTGENAQLPLTT